MNYQIKPVKIKQPERAGLNHRIVDQIESGNCMMDKETIFNTYSGLGGLHGLNQEDFDSYNEYAEAKKEYELGQFFTPHDLAQRMVQLVSPAPDDMVLDMCCGMGNFFNHLPNLYNAYGIDIDPNAVKVAKHLYPEANIDICDIRQYNPDKYFDFLIGNPPFNLDFDGIRSQFYYFNKAYWVLNPGAIMVAIVPCSFLQNEFWNKTMIKMINEDFSFIGQSKLHPDTFESLGVKNFDTKIIAFSRKSDNINMIPYSAESFITMSELKSRINDVKEINRGLKLKLFQEANEYSNGENYAYEYKLKKYLFELKAHKSLNKYHVKAIALVTKFRNQKRPEGLSNEEFKEWEKRKLTYPRVLSVLRKYIKNQNIIPRNEVALVRTKYGYRLKAYAPRLLDKINIQYVSFYDLIANEKSLPLFEKMTVKLKNQYHQANKVIQRKKKEFDLQCKPILEMQRVPSIDGYIDTLSFINPKDRKKTRFSELQKHDLGLIFQKKYLLLNWQQGSGKTAASYHYAKYRLLAGQVKNVIILAPANATDMTWEKFLTVNKEPFIKVEKAGDFKRLPTGIFIVIPLSRLHKFTREASQFIKSRSQKIFLLFDESDEITSMTAARTKATINTFRRTEYKLLATGTSTRNNINELYPQLELLYNNSHNMMCYCRDTYLEDKETKEIKLDTNPNRYFRCPFPPRRGANLFKSCFCPGHTSVFGIEKQNQDIYNKDELLSLIAKTIITRKFKEFAGDKYSIFTHIVTPTSDEKEVYRIIMDEFYSICDIYFRSTGDKRKDSQLRLIRQIQLLIKACSVPNLMPGYFGDSTPQKMLKIGKMINRMPNKVAIGCTMLDSLESYQHFLIDEFSNRPLFIIKGDINFKKRQKIIDQFEDTGNGILLSTQQSLKSSINIPSCNDVIIEALQWNIPKMEQYYFRFIRLDSEEHTNVHFVTYSDSIEQNLMALVLTKERLNEFIKDGEITQESEIFEEFDISPSIIQSLLQREADKDGKYQISWGMQKVS